MERIVDVMLRAVDLVEETGCRVALRSAIESNEVQGAALLVEEVFSELTKRARSVETLEKFVNGYGATHMTALYVSGLMIRIARAGKGLSGVAQHAIAEAVLELGEVIAEDTGVDDVPHGELFAIFSREITSGRDSWKLDRNRVEACDQFREKVKGDRLERDIEVGLLTTLASELWNTGEYTMAATRVPQWMKYELGVPDERVDQAVAYILVHAGDTELRHFLHVLSAWRKYCYATGGSADPKRLERCVTEYAAHVRSAFKALGQILCRT